MSQLRKHWRRSASFHVVFWAGLLILVGLCVRWAEFSLSDLLRSGPRFTEFFTRLTPPDWSVTRLILESTLETIMIAFAGTFLAFVVAGSIPLLSYLVDLGSLAFPFAVGLTVVGLFGIGAFRATVADGGWLRNGLEMLLVGMSAATVAYVVGVLLAPLT